jgi:hypothetical protein
MTTTDTEVVVFDLTLPVAVLFALIPFDAPNPDRDPAVVFFDTF